MLLRDRMYTTSTFARQFLVSWVIQCIDIIIIIKLSYLQIQFLDSVPDIHMHEHLPEFVDGLFLILGDHSTQIKKMYLEIVSVLYEIMNINNLSGLKIL